MSPKNRLVPRKPAPRKPRKKSKFASRKPSSTKRFKVPNTTVTLLSDPEKMPCYSWSLPAVRSCPRMNGDICKNCYARKGRYIMPNVVNALETRFTWTRESLKSGAGQDAWVDLMVRAITDATKFERVFRVHDSGDFFSPAYVRMWIRVCIALPAVKFWFPTRSYQIPLNGRTSFMIVGQDDPIMSELLKLAGLPNVTVRPSALDVDEPAPRIQGLSAGSSVRDKSPAIGHQCPAYTQDGYCGPCRTCWFATDTAITYPLH